MASSSDESFAWTNASNSSNSSSDCDQTANHKMTENGLNEDSDYGKSYKKKLHKKLFVKNEADDQSETESRHPKEKKRKHKMPDEDIESPKKKKIKIEPESDIDTPKKKKKKKLERQHPEESPHNNMSNTEMLQDYSDQILTVKEEQGFGTTSKSKKQRKSTQSSTSMTSNHDMEYSMNNIKKEESNTELHETSCAAAKDEVFTKKKKSKKRRQSLCEDDSMGQEDKCSEDIASNSQHNCTEPIVKIEKSSFKTEKSKSKQEGKNVYNCSSDKSELLSDGVSDNELHKHKDKIKSHKNSISDLIELPEKNKKLESRISDKIKNKDADNTQIDTSIINKADSTKSRKIKKFLKINENLKQICPTEHEWTLSSDDEIWAIKCPQSIDVNSFLGTNIKLNGKCKIKLDNQTHVGSMNCESAHLTVLLSEHDDYVIKKLPLSGTLHLHMKLPKVHVSDNNFLDNQTDFVPVPNTKKRHPLFGSNYKKAIKVPSTVAQKLNESYNDSISEIITKKTKKKKHKINKQIDNEQIQETYEPLSTENNTSINSKKKNRKRKHKTETEHSSTKRVKFDADSSTVWESEQAIEKNLFNS